MRIDGALAAATERLSHRGIPDASLEAEVIVRHVMGLDRAKIFAIPEQRLSNRQQQHVSQLVRRRLEGEPLAYILGHREFYGLDFVVDHHVLIPRQETELLVDKVLEFANGRAGERLRIADVGTGCGAVAIAVAQHVPQATLYATDISRQVLSVADINRRAHGVVDRVHLREGDLLHALDGPVDAVVCNPPYIRTGQIAHLRPEVRREPIGALDGGSDGLGVMRSLMRQAPSYLRTGARLLVEIAPEQLATVIRMAREHIPGASVSFARDLLGMPRVVIADSTGEQH